MSLTIDEISNGSLLLPAEERTILAYRLWDSVADFADMEIEDAWLAESDRRWKQIEKNEVKCIPHEEVMQRLRGTLNCKK